MQFHGEMDADEEEEESRKQGEDAHNPYPKRVNEQWAGQNSIIAAWDVTVVDANGVEQRGRMRTKALPLNTGSNAPGTAIYSGIYVLTHDGYLYLVNTVAFGEREAFHFRKRLRAPSVPAGGG